MPLLPPSENNDEWLERRHLSWKCPHCHAPYAKSEDAQKCCKEASIVKSQTDFDPFRACKQGYKYYRGSYWQKVGYAPDRKCVTMNDVDGIWLKVTMLEATYELLPTKKANEDEQCLEAKAAKTKTESISATPLTKCDRCGKKSVVWNEQFLLYECFNPYCGQRRAHSDIGKPVADNTNSFDYSQGEIEYGADISP